MATTFSTITVPTAMSLSGQWTPWKVFEMLSIQGPGRPFPETKGDRSALWFANEISNTLISLESPGNVGIQTLLGIMAPGISAPVSESATISIHRAWQHVLFTGGGQGAGTVSPQLGFNLGNKFKHQAYYGFDGMAIGSSLGATTFWYASGCYASMDYVVNCRFYKTIVQQGKVISTRFDTLVSPPILYIQLCNSQNSPPGSVLGSGSVAGSSGFSPGGNLYVSTTVPIKNTTNISVIVEKIPITVNINSRWEIAWKDTAATADMILNKRSSSHIQAGNFFVLDKPWVIQDPALMFEYGLSVGNEEKSIGALKGSKGAAGSSGYVQPDGTAMPTTQDLTNLSTNIKYYRTLNQKPFMKYFINGLFVPQMVTTGSSGTGGAGGTSGSGGITERLYVAYADIADQSAIDLPINPHQQTLRGEAMAPGGEFADGLNALNSQSPSLSTIRLILGPNPVPDNFVAGNLVGEFIRIDDHGTSYWFEITGQMRNDAVDVSVTCVNSPYKTLYDFLATIGTVYILQQNFWLINEMYPGIGQGTTGLYYNKTSAGPVGSAGEYTLSWKAQSVQQAKILLSPEPVAGFLTAPAKS